MDECAVRCLLAPEPVQGPCSVNASRREVRSPVCDSPAASQAPHVVLGTQSALRVRVPCPLSSFPPSTPR